jgi:hypothetical protein
VNVDKKSLTDKLADRLEGAAKQSFDEIMCISKETAKQGRGYNHSPYQVYVASQCFAQSAKVVPMLLGPGQGKSYICYMLARRHAENGQDVCIVVHSGPA